RVAASLALLGVVAVWGVRDYEHGRAVKVLESRVYDGADPLRASAYPYWINPFRWYGVVETRDNFATMLVDSSIPEADTEGRMRIRPKPEETPVTLAAKRSYLGRVYLDWAQYPITETEALEPPGAGYIVDFQDLRFVPLPNLLGRGGRRRALGAGVQLDRNLHVVGDVYGYGPARVTVPEPGIGNKLWPTD